MTTVACRNKGKLLGLPCGGGNKKQGIPSVATGWWFNCSGVQTANWDRAVPGPKSKFVLSKVNQIGGVGFGRCYQTQEPADAPNPNNKNAFPEFVNGNFRKNNLKYIMKL